MDTLSLKEEAQMPVLKMLMNVDWKYLPSKQMLKSK